MADDEKLKPEDFPVHAEQKKIVKDDGKTIADASDKKIAEDVGTFANKTAGRHNFSGRKFLACRWRSPISGGAMPSG